MKRIILSVLFGVCVLSATAQVDPPLWSWTAPEPPLPGTVWYDYGWDSTSNGPVPAEQVQMAQATVGRRAVMAPPLPPAPALKAPLLPTKHAMNDRVGHFYSDQFLTLHTADFESEEFGYGLGVGYQVNANWGADIRVTHEGLDVDGSLVQGIGCRLVARMPFKYLSPYGFLGGSFDLERDQWAIQPGAGIEVTPSKSLQRLALFVEGQLNADVDGHNTYSFASGVRWRW